MNLFFVYKGILQEGLEKPLYPARLDNLEEMEIAAAFPRRLEAVGFALGLSEIYPVVVVERSFRLLAGDNNNLISLCEWNKKQVDEETDPVDPIDPNPEPPVLTGSIAIVGQAIVGFNLTAMPSAINGQGTIHYQWQISNDNNTFSDIPSAIADYYVITSDDVDKYIRVFITTDGTTGTLYSSSTDIVQDV